MDMKLLDTEELLKCQQEEKRVGKTTVEKVRWGRIKL